MPPKIGCYLCLVVTPPTAINLWSFWLLFQAIVGNKDSLVELSFMRDQILLAIEHLITAINITNELSVR